MAYRASKFNKETDEDRPKIDSIIETGTHKTYKIIKVDAMNLSDVITKSEPELDGAEAIVTKQHSTRPAVIWLIWVTQLK